MTTTGAHSVDPRWEIRPERDTRASAPRVIERTRLRVAALRPYPRDLRAISRAQLDSLKRSIQEDSDLLEIRPILVNSFPGSEGVIVAGNQRWLAAKELGWDEVPVILVSVPPEIAARWAIKDNNQWATWVEDELAQLLAELDAGGVDLDHLGFEPDDLERLLGLASAKVTGEDEHFDPTPPLVAESRSGDLLLLGPHRVACGDARDGRAWDLLLGPAESETTVDCLWTDPPYGVDLGKVALPSRGAPGALAIIGDTEEEVAPLLQAVFAQADRRLRAGAPFYIAGPEGRLGSTFVAAVEGTGWHLAQTLVWVKNTFVPGRSDYHHQHEAVYYGWKTGAAHAWLGAVDQPSVVDDEPNLARMDRRALVALVKELRNARNTDVLREDKPTMSDLHPTMKPTALIRRMLANSTRRGDLVLDPFAGSGSTLIAAHLMGRRAALIELEPRFADVIAWRWLALAGANTALRVREGETTPISR